MCLLILSADSFYSMCFTGVSRFSFFILLFSSRVEFGNTDELGSVRNFDHFCVWNFYRKYVFESAFLSMMFIKCKQ